MKVLFLDIDGCMNDSAWSENVWNNTDHGMPMWHMFPFPEHIVNNFQKVLETLPDMKIVVSSTWRIHYQESIFRILEKRAKIPFDRFIGLTPVIQNKERGDEIKAWLEGKEVEKFVILDDDIFNIEKDLHKRLVMPNYTIGLTEQEADEIIRLFQE